MGARREPEVQSFLAHLPLFQGLRPDELERLAAGSTLRRLRRGETLFRQGEQSSGFHAVTSANSASADSCSTLGRSSQSILFIFLTTTNSSRFEPTVP